MPIGNVIICKGEGGNDGKGDGSGAATDKQEEAMGHELPIDIRMSCLLNGERENYKYSFCFPIQQLACMIFPGTTTVSPDTPVWF